MQLMSQDAGDILGISLGYFGDILGISLGYFLSTSKMSGFGRIRAISGVVIICKWVVC